MRDRRALMVGPGGVACRAGRGHERGKGSGWQGVVHGRRLCRPHMRRGPGGVAESEVKNAVQRPFLFPKRCCGCPRRSA